MILQHATDSRDRLSAAQGLNRLRTEAAESALIEAMQDESDAARTSLEKIKGRTRRPR
jgi:HEAT repeat protein